MGGGGGTRSWKDNGIGAARKTGGELPAGRARTRKEKGAARGRKKRGMNGSSSGRSERKGALKKIVQEDIGKREGEKVAGRKRRRAAGNGEKARKEGRK